MDKKIKLKVGDASVIADIHSSYDEARDIKSVIVKYISTDVIVVEEENGESIIFDNYYLGRDGVYINMSRSNNLLFNGTFKDFENHEAKIREIIRVRDKLETLSLEELKELLND